MNPDVVAEATHRVLFWWIVASCWRRSRLLCLAGPVSVRDATARLVARQVRATAETGSVGRCSDKRPDSDVLSSRHIIRLKCRIGGADMSAMLEG